jgi:toxin ParE1/3/4
MLKHTLSSIAESDLSDIWAYLVEQSGSLEIAEEFLGRIQRAIELLCSHPRLGSPRPDLDADVRSFPVGHYLIVY